MKKDCTRNSIRIKTMISLATLFFTSMAHTQNLEIKKTTLADGDVIINYELLDDNLDHRYVIGLYSSADDYIQPLGEVEGDVGIDLSVGGNKKVVWHASRELGEDFKGNVALELKGRLYIPFVRLNDFDKIKKIKKERPVQVTWAAGRGSDVLTWDLFNSKDELVHTFTNIANVGEYELVIPKGVNPGKAYYFRITDQDNKDDMVRTTRFQVSRKLPIYVNAAMVAAGLGIGYFIVTNLGSGGGETINPGPDPIPDPSRP